MTLPPWLAERTHAPSEPRPGAYVLYWMRVAMRAHENPALDVALEAAHQLGLPMTVYQGLSERYPYASDRHHTFILEGARDVQRALHARDIGYLFHVERPGARQGVLRTLAEGAALVITEDMPVPPLDAWAATIGRVAPLWLVDTACVVPMRSVHAVCDRAFRFRQQIERALEERLSRPWTEERRGDGFVPASAPPALDAASIDIETIVASCAIDHGVAPVPHTRGGSEAGYARWTAFRDEGLRRYAYDRNDPLREGVSRMSAYLHYGMVSPMRIAREAARFDKYIDELVVWRELAFHFCLHRSAKGALASLDSLPRWAVETLLRHAADPRPALYTWEALSRGVTHDALWNAAQASLRIHGELHNNVRMTWGKMLLELTATPQRALEMLIDLNHRYALDGRDPASYGGLLWCLGLFDRPFAPERSIHGTVRNRSTREHASRLDVKRYAAQVRRPALVAPHAPASGPAPMRVAVVGAGVSGLACARTIIDHGHDALLVDKARRPGGRLASHREGFDHGAPAFSVTRPELRRLMESWVETGIAAPWTPRCARLTHGHLEAIPAVHAWFVGVPTNNHVAAHLASDLAMRVETRVTRLSKTAEGWTLQSDTETLGPFDAVVLSLPPTQTRELLRASGWDAPLAEVAMHAHVTAMVTSDEPLAFLADVIAIADGPVACVIREGSKPGRRDGERLTMHFTPAWSATHLDTEAEALHRAVTEALRATSSLSPVWSATAAVTKVHRWRYARTARLVDGLPGLCDEAEPVSSEPSAISIAPGLLTCGDGISGGGFERAFLSGVAAASRALAMSAPRALPDPSSR